VNWHSRRFILEEFVGVQAISALAAPLDGSSLGAAASF
jgi:hypothetical protein